MTGNRGVLSIFMLISLAKSEYYAVCSDGWIISETVDTCFYFSEEAKPWEEAKSYCTSPLQSQFVLLDTTYRQTRIQNVVNRHGKTGEWFIGLYYQYWLTLDWLWVNEVAMVTSYWGVDQPATSAFKNCAVIKGQESLWYNVDCDDPKKFICEKPPSWVPSTVARMTTVAPDLTSAQMKTAPPTLKTLADSQPTWVPSTVARMTTNAQDFTSAHMTTAPPILQTWGESQPGTSEMQMTSAGSSRWSTSPIDNSASTGASELFSSSSSAVILHRGCLVKTTSESTDLGQSVHLIAPHGTCLMLDCREGYRRNQHRATCNDGNWLPALLNCEDIDECDADRSDDICPINERCTNSVGSFECVCLNGFVRQTTSGLCAPDLPTPEISGESNDPEAFCNAERDAVLGLEWNRTQSNRYTDWVLCDGNQGGLFTSSQGIMRRYCDGQGNWATPDTTFCKSKAMSELEEIADRNVWGNATQSIDVLEQLVEILKAGGTLPGGDVIVSRNILAAIAGNQHLSRDLNDTLRLVQQFLEACSYSLDLNLVEQWRHIYENYGPGGSAASVLSISESFGATVYYYMVQTGENFYMRSENVDLVAYFVDDKSSQEIKRSKRSLPGNNTSTIHDSVTLSGDIRSRSNTNTTNSTVALVIFVYKEMGTLLPADFSRGPAKRTWVKTITATKIINKVNTNALAVSVYPSLGDVSYNADDLAVLRLYVKDEGYKPRCSAVDVGSNTGIWDTSVCRLLRQGTDDAGRYVECGCDRFGTFCAIMSMGKEPVPFLESSKQAVVIIFSSLSAFLILLTLVIIFIARLPSDRYFVLAQTILSMLSFAILVCTATVLEKRESSQKECKVLSVAMAYWLLSSCCWLLNASIQQLLALVFMERSNRARILYVIVGWFLPLVVTLAKYGGGLPDQKLIASCWLIKPGTTMSMFTVIGTLFMLVSLVIICRCYYILPDYVTKLDTKGILRVRDDLFQLMLLYGTFCTVRIIGFAVTLTGYSLGSFFFSLAVFCEGSVIFLSFATNREVLIAARMCIFGGEDDENSFHEDQTSESELSGSPSGSHQQIRDCMQNARYSRRPISAGAEKADRIQVLFEAARRSDVNN
ncbi:adhesion G protein-coupled receptor L4-like [Ptychodera flava]|uniref:adhesion G protein-coupled receptor L4-like n=1 Tax=Ptychodera flava TaxID=63121 RepID=UPI003969C846